MDPITLLLLCTGGVAAAGVAAAAGPLWQQLRLRRARELVTRPIIGAQVGGDQPRSVYDVFHDLGATDYALEVMRHLDVIPEREEEVEMAAQNLSDAIASFGSYELMVASLRETIQELSQDDEGDHREILEQRLTLSAPRQTDALLPAVNRPTGQLPASDEVKRLQAGLDGQGALPSGGEAGQPPPGQPLGEGPRLHATVDEALAELFGPGRSPQAGALQDGAGGLAAIVIGGVLGSLSTGGFWDGVSRFVQRRRVKQMRSRLNAELSGLSLDLFHAPPPITGQVERNLNALVQQKRWAVERTRREVARHRKLPKKQRSAPLLVLKLLSAQAAREGLTQAERDVKKLQAQVTRHRRSGRHDLAGFLIYVNRGDLFKGVSAFDQRFQAIEEAGEALRQALLAEAPGAQPPSLTAGAAAPEADDDDRS